jgi:hypothetical protein
VLGWPGVLGSRVLRRLQLAAETGGSLGFLVRSAKLLGKPTWSDIQLLVQPRPTPPQAVNRRLRVEVRRCREGQAGGQVELEISEIGLIHEASTLPLAAGLADSTAPHRSASA